MALAPALPFGLVVIRGHWFEESDRLAADVVRERPPAPGVDSQERVAQYRSGLQCGDDAPRLAATLKALRGSLSAR